jgi:hypothetical protein
MGNPRWILILVAALAALAALVLPKLAPGLVRRLTLALLGEKGRAKVGQRVLERQPDRITLAPHAGPPGAEAKAILDGLAWTGYRPAGSFTVAEMGGLPIHLLVKPAECAVAAVYEHPKAGVWFDLFTRYQDGTSFTLATARKGGGLDQRPGHPTIRAPGLDPAAARARFLRERPAGALKSFSAAEVPSMFADAYAEAMAWRKQRGITAAEVQRVGLEK